MKPVAITNIEYFWQAGYHDGLAGREKTKWAYCDDWWRPKELYAAGLAAGRKSKTDNHTTASQ